MHHGIRASIAPADEADVPVLLDMIRELAEFEKLQDEVAVTHAALHAALFGRTPVAGALLAHAGGAAAGYAVYYRTFSTFAGRPGVYLEDVYVRPVYRRQGLGRALLEEAYRVGGGSGCGRYEWAALKWNGGALRFYQTLGARLLDEWVGVRLSGESLRRLMEKEVV